MDENIEEEHLAPSPHEQIISIQERMKILENQIREIESDLPQNLSKSILNMKKNIQMVTEQSNLQSDYQAPYVYSEVLEKIGDFQRRVEWKLKDVIQNKLFDINSQLEESHEFSHDEEKNATKELHNQISGSLENLKINVNTSFEEDKKSLTDLEEQLSQIKFQAKAASNTPSKITLHILNEIKSQQKQINELEKTLNRIPNLIGNSRRLNEKFSNLSQSQDIIQHADNNSMSKNSQDLETQLSTLESEVQTTISSFQFDLDNILKRIEIVDQKSDENEKQIIKIADIHGKMAELLSDIEDKTLSMLDKSDDFKSKLSLNQDSAPLEEMEKETRIQLRAFKREITTFKFEISKREAQITQNSLSTT